MVCVQPPLSPVEASLGAEAKAKAGQKAPWCCHLSELLPAGVMLPPPAPCTVTSLKPSFPEPCKYRKICLFLSREDLEKHLARAWAWGHLWGAHCPVCSSHLLFLFFPFAFSFCSQEFNANHTSSTSLTPNFGLWGVDVIAQG